MPSTNASSAIAGWDAHTVLDDYGATDPAEFFAVATECFFEKPRSASRNDIRNYMRN